MSPRRSKELPSAFLAAFLEDDPEDLYQNAPCAYLSAAPDGTIVKVNATFLDWTGYGRAELEGQTRWQDLLSVGDRIFYETHFAPALRLQGKAREVALSLVTNGGDPLHVLVNAAMKMDEDGEPVVIRIVLFDARERRAYETELVAAKRRAEESEQRAAALARTLQASLLPRELIEAEGLDIGAAYRAAGDGSEVGGDFYDTIGLSPTTSAFVLGDVCGKGPDAAVLTALARDTVRREVLQTQDPVEVLGAVRDVILRYHPEQFCTAVMLVLTASEDGFELRSSAGGHHLPLLRRPDGTFGELGTPGTLLGLIAKGTTHEHRGTLHPGDTVVLYTDGLPEARKGDEFFGEARVRSAVSAVAAEPAQEMADALVAAALDFQDGTPRDDIAVLVLKVP